jgi:hypothetical protein
MGDTRTAPGAHTDELILEALAEGGSLTLSARRKAADWTRFALVVDEGTLADLLGEDGPAEPGDWVYTDGPADTWEAALGLLDRSGWTNLHPDYVHPDFRPMVLSAVRERAADGAHTRPVLIHKRLSERERICSAA